MKYLYVEIGKILGLDKKHTVVIIGAGNLGRAIANYANFEKRGFIIEGIFDINPKLKGSTIRGIEVRNLDDIEEFAKTHEIDIVALTIPKTQAVDVAERLAGLGVKAFWNFAHTDLNVPDNVIVESVHLSESLMRISYMLENGQEL